MRNWARFKQKNVTRGIRYLSYVERYRAKLDGGNNGVKNKNYKTGLGLFIKWGIKLPRDKRE